MSRPTWPTLFPDYEFVRFFGSIRKRKLGGLSGWIGENAVCEANRALRFRQFPNFEDDSSFLYVSFFVPFRRFYFDGLAVGKFEVGIATRGTEGRILTREQTKKIIYRFLNFMVDIPVPPDKLVRCKLWQSNKYLARLYAIASTSISRLNTKQLENWWVRPGPPLLFLVTHPEEKIQIPFRGMLVPVQQQSGFDLSHYLVPHEGKNIPMWVLNLNRHTNLNVARAIRICLLRLHAEHECLKLVLQNIATKKFKITPGTTTSDTIQRYLNEATRRISRLGTKSDSLSDIQLAELARISEDTINPGERDAILESLRNIDVRRNIFNKVKEYFNQTIHIQEQIMGDNYNVGQAGAVGPHSQAQHMNFNQIWNQACGSINLSDLAKELEILRAGLLKEASLPEQYSAIGAVASAETAAQNGDGPKALKYLAQAGHWAFDTATK